MNEGKLMTILQRIQSYFACRMLFKDLSRLEMIESYGNEFYATQVFSITQTRTDN
jgi:hypothetical protein